MDFFGILDLLITQSNLRLAKAAKEILADKKFIGLLFDRGLYTENEAKKYFAKANWYLSTIGQLIEVRYHNGYFGGGNGNASQ